MSKFRTLAELSEDSGIPARTIRFYIARGLVDGPVKAGRGAVYTAQHLARLEKIAEMQGEGRSLSDIANALNESARARASVSSSRWWQHIIDEDVTVWVRGDVTPWRMKQIRSAVDDLASRLRDGSASNSSQDNNSRMDTE